MIDIALKKVDNLNRIVIPTNWLDELKEDKLMMYSVENKKQAVIIPENDYKVSEINPIILDLASFTDKGLMTIKKKFRKFLEIQENDFIELIFNKKLKIIVLKKVKIRQLESKFEKEFAKFFSDPIVKKNIELINKLEKQEQQRNNKK